jgi:hypothetical protein
MYPEEIMLNWDLAIGNSGPIQKKECLMPTGK